MTMHEYAWAKAARAAGADAQHLHLIVLWTTQHASAPKVYLEVLQSFNVVGVRLHPAYANRSLRIAALNRFYQDTRHNQNVDDVRGSQPFALLFVKLPASLNVPCAGGASARGMSACPPTNDFKNSVRARYRGLRLHATDSLAEMRSNTAALGIDYEEAITGRLRLWANRSAALGTLEAAGLEYAMMREWECVDLVAHGQGIDRCGDDLDMIGGSCLAIAYELSPPIGVPPPPTLYALMQPSTAVVRLPLVMSAARHNSHTLTVEVRCIGSGYLDDKWLRDALQRRVLQPGGFHSVGHVDHIFGLLYHNLIQKRRPTIPAYHWTQLSRALSYNGNPPSEDTELSELQTAVAQRSDSLAATALQHFMRERGYRNVSQLRVHSQGATMKTAAAASASMSKSGVPVTASNYTSAAGITCLRSAAEMVKDLQLTPFAGGLCYPSVLYMDANRTIVLKQYMLFLKYTPRERETCALQALQHFAWAPQWLCTGDDYMLTLYAGRQACRERVPADFLAQVGVIMRDLHAVGMRHNDLQKEPEQTEFVVSDAGRVSLIDYGWATLNKSLSMSCDAHGARLTASSRSPSNKQLHRGFRAPESNQTVKVSTLPRCKPSASSPPPLSAPHAVHLAMTHPESDKQAFGYCAGYHRAVKYGHADNTSSQVHDYKPLFVAPATVGHTWRGSGR